MLLSDVIIIDWKILFKYVIIVFGYILLKEVLIKDSNMLLIDFMI